MRVWAADQVGSAEDMRLTSRLDMTIWPANFNTDYARLLCSTGLGHFAIRPRASETNDRMIVWQYDRMIV